MRDKYWEYTNSDTGFFCLIFGLLFVVFGSLVMGLEEVTAGACIFGFGIFLILCAIGWLLRYKHYKAEYERKTGMKW